ncbi:MAG: hypothetical protein ACT6SC_11370, partial [Blastomonas fulva]
MASLIDNLLGFIGWGYHSVDGGITPTTAKCSLDPDTNCIVFDRGMQKGRRVAPTAFVSVTVREGWIRQPAQAPAGLFLAPLPAGPD